MNALKKLNQAILKHELLLEDLNIPLVLANKYVSIMHDFLESLNFRNDRIEALECRSRDGFIPHSYNFGGLEAVSFMDQYSAKQWLYPFKNASKTLEKAYKYDVEYFNESIGRNKDDEILKDQYEAFDNYRMEDTEATVLFGCDLMLTSENTLNIRITVCVKDAPYHRQYDDLIEFDLKFKNEKDLELKLKKLLSNKQVKAFSRAVKESY